MRISSIVAAPLVIGGVCRAPAGRLGFDGSACPAIRASRPRRSRSLMPDPTVVITFRGEDRLRRGHSWIYRADVVEANAAAGDTVVLLGPRRRRLGRALYSDRSQITLRVLTRLDEDAGPDLWRQRIDVALRFRQSLGIDATAMRLVHGEADLLPSLVVDRYADWLVVQALSQGVDRLMPSIVTALVETVRPAGIL